MKLYHLVFLLVCSEVLASPVNKQNEHEILNRGIRSPHIFKKKPLGLLGALGGGGGGGGYGGGNYVTNINNYGPNHQSYKPEVTGGHGYEGGSFAGSAAVAGGHGSQAQSQSASFSFGPYTAAFSQSQAQGGGSGKGGFDIYSDY
ncbi:putative glycine-rich cell wall structural protein 1 [Anoplophora glabripennis]|uniref:putative glycine-rich cell wall structural protein 1 n=1 Tax=Anoplophora glabripennis TaxID=217634 RepID=UPI00087598DD|nr:putative glycine-rich cell wall structural protein 1 [Anoplophora glabripennis]